MSGKSAQEKRSLGQLKSMGMMSNAPQLIHIENSSLKFGILRNPSNRLSKSTFSSSNESSNFGFGNSISGIWISGETKEFRLMIWEKSKLRGENSGGLMITSIFGSPRISGIPGISFSLIAGTLISGIVKFGGWKLKLGNLNWQLSKLQSSMSGKVKSSNIKSGRSTLKKGPNLNSGNLISGMIIENWERGNFGIDGAPIGHPCIGLFGKSIIVSPNSVNCGVNNSRISGPAI